MANSIAVNVTGQFISLVERKGDFEILVSVEDAHETIDRMQQAIRHLTNPTEYGFTPDYDNIQSEEPNVFIKVVAAGPLT